MLKFKIRLFNYIYNIRIQFQKSIGPSYYIDRGITGPSKLYNDTSLEIEEGRKEPMIKGIFYIILILIWRATSG